MRPVMVLVHLIRFSPAAFVGCVLFATVAYALLPIALGLATQAFFDALTGDSAGVTAWTAIALLVGLQVGELIAEVGGAFAWTAMQYRSHVLLQRNMFAGILRGFGRHGLPEPPGETVSRFRDEPANIASGSLDAVCDLMGRALFAAVAAIIMWRLHPMITVALFAPLLLTSIVTELLGGKTSAYRAASREATGRLTGFLGELVGAQLSLSAAGAIPHAVGRLREMGEQRRRLAVRDSVFGELLSSISRHFVHIGTGVVLLFGAGAVRDGSLTVGELALFVVFLDQLTWLPEEIGRLISELKRTAVSFGRMRAVVPGEPAAALVTRDPLHLGDAPAAAPPPPPRERLERLEVRTLGYAHRNGGAGIADVSFVLERGSFTVITGRIGAGKTTLLQVLLGLLERQAGEILWNGRTIEDPASFFVPPRSAYTPQVPRLFSETMRENLSLGRPDDAAALELAVHAAVLDTDVAALDRGLETLVGPRGVKLSGGQIQRTAAARMFIRAAELLVLDDLSSALDLETEATLWKRLFERGRDITCLVVSHRPAALRRADQILVMDAGRVVARGTPSELLVHSVELQHLWRSEQPIGGTSAPGS